MLGIVVVGLTDLHYRGLRVLRELVLDTETTGLDPALGHRIVEIGCVELINYIPTGRTYHQYLNPERDMPDGALRIHGLSQEFLSKFPRFIDIVENFIEFIGEDMLVMHNSSFDMGFINNELARISREKLPSSRSIDTLQLARSKFPGAQVSLEALCRRFEVDDSSRNKHGALLDAELLAAVYLQLIGGRQPDLDLSSAKLELKDRENSKKLRNARAHTVSKAEREAHDAFVARLPDPLWKR